MTRMTASERREQLLDAAERVMMREGVAAGTTRAVVAEAGMHTSVFHYCFRSRDEMISELILRLGSRERSAVWDHVVPSSDIREMLASAAQAYMAHLTANPGQELMLLELNHHALRTPELAGLAARQYDMYLESARHVLALAAEFTGHRWSLDETAMARLTISIIDGVTTTWLADRDTERTWEILAHLLDHVASLAVPLEVSVEAQLGCARE